MIIDEVLKEIAAKHFPNPAAAVEEIVAFEVLNGWKLNEEMRNFYLFCNGARLFDPLDTAYSILSLNAIKRARVAVFGTDGDEYGPSTLYAVCDNRDTNYVAVNVPSSTREPYLFFDVFHECVPSLAEDKIVARSFCEFLVRALGSNGTLYWLSENYRGRAILL